MEPITQIGSIETAFRGVLLNMGYNFETTPERSKLMKKIKGVDTKPEVVLRKALWQRGFRYRKNYGALPGKPDIFITKHNVAVFIDGEFWHGYNWEEKKDKIRSNRGYWIPKIENNMKRDKKVNEELRMKGYTVVRLWEMDVKKNLEGCLNKIEEAITGKSTK